MREISFGPVYNEDGSPSDLTIAMLAGTGRTMTKGESLMSSLHGHRASEARRGANKIREDAFNKVLDGAYEEMSTRELFAFCDAMQVFAPIVIHE